MNQRPAVLVIAGSDSSGGAGLTRDVQTLTHFNVDALCAVTAVTAQSNSRVLAIHHVPPETIQAQIEGAFASRAVGAIKIGMLGTGATVAAVAECLAARAPIPIVLDPVLLSSSGGVLLDSAGRKLMLDALLPLVTLVTPNIPEAAALLGEEAAEEETTLISQAQRLLERGARERPAPEVHAGLPPEATTSRAPVPAAPAGPAAVLLKGGHATGAQAVDLLVTRKGGVERLVSARVHASRRGTGCALASAIAAGLAAGLPLSEACRQAKTYLQQMLTTAMADSAKR